MSPTPSSTFPSSVPAGVTDQPSTTALQSSSGQSSSGGHRAALVVGAVLAVLGIAYAAANLLDLLAHHHTRTAQTFAATALVDVSADGDVQVTTGDVSSITVLTDVSHGVRSPHTSAEVVGDRLVLRSTCPAFVQIWCHVSYTLEVPFGTRLVVHSDNGDVHATLKGGSIDATSDNGDVGLSFTAAPTHVAVHSDNGDVLVVVPADGTTYAVSGSTGNGERRVSVPTASASPASIAATSDNGDVTIRTVP